MSLSVTPGCIRPGPACGIEVAHAWVRPRTYFSTSVSFLAAFALIANTRIARCLFSLVPITASGTNFDLLSGVRPANATLPISSTFRVQLRFCEPDGLADYHARARGDTLQILVHDLTYVRLAMVQGFPTHNLARLGYGLSDHPDNAHSTFTKVAIAAAFVPTRDLNRARFGRLSAEYFASFQSFHAKSVFYGAEGTLKPPALAFDEAQKDTATTGELLTSTLGTVLAPACGGGVLTID
ncbi:hypothetical protein EXIGLDRAFT_784267 [Exidia glandulosa HHB12029]|uniref:Uncharacterized protein n=1 Tax=Exidia glandulosa HHB12029 TaxID=1314781 RepID=A0A165YZP3_EXIGL|nr:hypothetical protein EXIGLDRAFT_784267 [Exidia glandulosa HHB12029]